jgi:hypothetical protein
MLFLRWGRRFCISQRRERFNVRRFLLYLIQGCVSAHFIFLLTFSGGLDILQPSE